MKYNITVKFQIDSHDYSRGEIASNKEACELGRAMVENTADFPVDFIVEAVADIKNNY